MQTLTKTKVLTLKSGKATIRLAFNCDKLLGKTFKQTIKENGHSLTYIFEKLMRDYLDKQNLTNGIMGEPAQSFKRYDK